MGLFSRKKKEDLRPRPFENVPLLPSLPKLPDFPRLEGSEYGDSMQIHKLPSFPSSSLGAKFSQDTIKDAVAGEEGGFDGGEGSMDEDEMRMAQQEPLRRPMAEEFGMGPRFSSTKMRGEPVFIRIDKFEEALKIFNDAKRKISDIERVLDEIKVVKEREEKELQSWENEVKAMKDQISRVEKDIFSKI